MTYVNKKHDFLLYFFFIGLVFLVLALLSRLLNIQQLTALEVASNKINYKSYHTANLLRRSSDDLTKMVRLYVITGNKNYLDHFNEILSIRNGTSPRPKEYNNVYWDLVLKDKRPSAYGEKKSLVNLMIEYNFSPIEFSLLTKSQELSNKLALIEKKAINAVSGKYDSGNGTYTIQGEPNKNLAVSLVFGPEYMRLKSQIMKPIRDFIDHVEWRMVHEDKKLFQRVDKVISRSIFLSVLSVLIIIMSISKALGRIRKSANDNEKLLLNILPATIADRLKNGEKVIADEYPTASIIFCDIVGFTAMTEKIGTSNMFDILGYLYDDFDLLAQKYGIEKIKTIGDCYMAASGIPEPAADHSERLADFALAIQDKVKDVATKHNLNISSRIGLACGPVIAGVIGHNKFIYDVWGDVVNTASRMESTSLSGKIQVTEEMAKALEEKFLIEKRCEIKVKGKGTMQTYFVYERRINI